MSKESLPQPQNEEVDLGQLFEAIGRLFERFYNFILSILKGILSIFVNTSKAVIDNFKLILLVLIIAAAAGFGVEKFMTPLYDSTMLVRTHFDSKYQLHTNLNYYNAVLRDENYSILANIFNLDEETIKEIRDFEIAPGPETENDRIVQYDRFIRSLDSVRAQEISFDDYIENRDVFSGNIFEIKVETTKNDIFKSLEEGLFNSFQNLHSIEKKKIRDSMIVIRRNNILSTMAGIDSLQSVYINVIEEESQSTKAKISLGDGFPLQQEKSSTKEYQLLNKQIELRKELRQLEEKKVSESEFFEVVSSFQEIGNKVGGLKRKPSLIFPALALILLCLGYLIKNYVKFVKNYEG